jgi:multidrug resistance protein MdtO
MSATDPAAPSEWIGLAALDRAPRRSTFWQFLRDELAVSPSRWSRMVRITVVVSIVTVVSQALHVPQLGVSAFLILMVSASDVATTLRTGIGGVVAVTLAIVLTFLLYSLTIGEPALRVAAMICLVFAGMYFSRISPLGPVGFLASFVCTYALTFPDRGASPEQLVRQLLWAWVFVAYPVGLLVILDLIAGRRPADVFRDEIGERLEAAAAFLAAPGSGDERARKRVERFERLGTGAIAAHVKAGPPAGAAARAAILGQVDLLLLLLRELPAEAKGEPVTQAALARAGEACLQARRILSGEGAGRAEGSGVLDPARPGTETSTAATLAVVLPLLDCVKELGLSVVEARHPSAAPAGAAARAPAAAPPNKVEAVRFSLKVTVAVMIAYVIYTSLVWQDIHTAMITCFFVAAASIGATIHKLTLRITGAVIGASLGIGAIVFVLPQLETIGGLVVLVAAVTLFAAWISTGSQAISYAGVQVALAFYLTVLQGWTRTSKMVVGRDRVIGILLGNVIMSVVFSTLWPVRIKPVVRQSLSRALEALATMLRLGRGDPSTPGLREAEVAFQTNLRAAEQYAPALQLETGGDDRWSLIPAVESLFVRIDALVRQPLGPRPLPPEAAGALSALGEGAASWLSGAAAALSGPGAIPAFRGASAGQTEQAVARPGETDQAALRLRLEWLGLVHRQIEGLAARASSPEPQELAQ